MVFGFLEPKGKVAPGGLSLDNRNLSSTFTEHHLSSVNLAKEYSQSNIDEKNALKSQGLTTVDAERILAINGPNILPPAKEISNLMLFFRQFLNILWLLLIFAIALSILGFAVNPREYDNLIVAIILIVMIVIMCFASFLQERKARAAVKGFANLLPASCSVIRDGQERTVTADKLVVGDIVIIKTGSRVPADARILQSSGLKLETSSITGEPEPIEFHAEEADPHVTVFESQNVAFNGSFCVDGEGIGLVIRTGQNTIIGQIAALTTNQKNVKSSLELEIMHFVKFLAVLSLTLGVAVFLVGAIINKWQNVFYYIINAFLVIIIANVPQGLPATVTSQLTIVTRRLATINVYLKRLDVVEALGSTTIIASDKTGTLTMNKMTVTDLWSDTNLIEGFAKVKPGQHRSTDLSDLFDSPIDKLLTVMCVCNKAQFDDAESGKKSIMPLALPNIDMEKGTPITQQPNPPRPVTGSPSEAAMLVYGNHLFSVTALRSRYPIVFEIPFNSKRKWHLQIATIQSKTMENDGQLIPTGKRRYQLMMKGAPEILIKKCSKIATAAGSVMLDEKMLQKFQSAYDNFAVNGRRVIGFVSKRFIEAENAKFEPDSGNYPIDGLTFLGMCAIMDPPREETAHAIAQCKTAGIKVFMVTGDHPSTAAAIARQIGLIGPVDQPENERDWDICHGEKIPSLTDDQWNELLSKKYLVFGRTTPEQKLLIVEQCQKRKEVITMTGDGVNDAPALKRADIGVAMGLTGSDVAKQAADIVLMDDNFASIVKGIEQGRLLFDNLKKTIAYTLSHLAPEIYPLILNFAVGIPLGLTTLQILTIDLGTELAPAISLAYEEIEADIMSQPPRKRTARLVSKGLLAYSYLFAGTLLSICSCAAYIYTFVINGVDMRDLYNSTNTYFKLGPNVPNFPLRDGGFLTPDQQVNVAAQAAAAWYIGTVFCQFFHIWSCRTRRRSIFTHGFRNYYTLAGVVIEAAILVICVYVPGIQFILGAAAPPRLVWVFPVVMSAIMLAINEGRKWVIRKWPRSLTAKLIKW